jgi:hypothetical protein
MILKLENGYLELNDLIEVEKKVKLFEDVSTTEGDFSYSFTIPKTNNNVRLISIYSTNDANRRWVRRINAEIQTETGSVIHKGFITIDGDNLRAYTASFFSGNSNWIDELNFSLLDLDWSAFDKSSLDFTSSEGVVMPLTDRGGLKNRMSAMFTLDDFQAYIYVKSLIQNILNFSGLKMSGDLQNNPLYNRMITSSGTNKALQNEIDKRTVYAASLINQTVTITPTTMVTPNVSSPYYNSQLNNFNTANYRYTADINLRYLTVELNLVLVKATPTNFIVVRVLQNGTDVVAAKGYFNVTKVIDKFEFIPSLTSAGDYIQVQVYKGASFIPNQTLVAGSNIKIYPTHFYKTFAAGVIPDMTAGVFLSNVFKMFNCLVSYNGNTKTLNVKNFDKVLESEPIDISEYMTISDNDFQDFISDYARKNLMVWQDQNNDDIEEYNDVNEYPYASGIIEIDNDALENQAEILEMDFAAPFQQDYGFLGIQLPLTDFIIYRTVETRELTAVTDSSDVAVFDYSGDPYPVQAIIRISESTVPEYNGEYFHFPLGVSTFFSYTPYLGNATGKIEIMQARYEQSDPVFLLNNPNLQIGDVAGVDQFYVNNLGAQTTIAVANFLETDNFRGSLDFSYLKPIYFNSTEKLLNKGVKSFAEGNLPEKVYNDIDFLRTVRINDSVYYVNKISGYKGSEYPVILELIKK